MTSNTSMRISAVLKFTSALIVASAAMGISAHAQSTTTSASSDQIEAVVVTANRRSENMQKVPIAITAITAEDAAKLGVTDNQSLMDQVPGLNFNRQANAAIPFLRGVGSPVGQPGDEPSVAFYVDDVYMPAGAGSLSNYNSIDRVEVEKGPQGTLFGRNATGGVVQVFTKNPSDTPEFDASVGYANYDTVNGSIYASGPLSDTLSGNISLYGQRQNDGWGKDRCGQLYAAFGCTTNSSTFKGWDFGGRAKLLWEPDAVTSALLTVDYDKTNTQEGLGFHAWPGTFSAPGVPPPSGFYDTIEDEPSYFNTKQDGVSLKVTREMGFANLVSITSWRDLHSQSHLDEDAGPLPLVDTNLGTLEKTWTQELQLLSPDDNARFTWILGGFYYNDRVSAPYYFYGLAIPTFTGGPATATGTGYQNTSSWALFGQGKYQLFSDTDLTIGLRYTEDTRKFKATVTLPGAIPVEAANSPMQKTWPKLTGRIALDHQFSDDFMGYVAFNRGFKSGVYNTTVFPIPGAPTQGPVNPEVLDAYTAGFKSEFAQHTVRFNVEGFLYHYSNIQIDEVIGAQTVLSNAASAIMKGVDADLTWLPIDNLTLTASAEYLDGHYGNFSDGIFFVYNGAGNCTFAPFNASGCPAGVTPPNYNPVTGQWNLKGLHTIQSPPFSLTLSGNYTIPTSVGPFDLNLSYFHGGDYYADADNGLGQLSQKYDRQKVLNIFNGSLGWTSQDGVWGARFWGKNITNVKYWSFSLEDAFATQYSPAPPRTFGVTVDVHY